MLPRLYVIVLNFWSLEVLLSLLFCKMKLHWEKCRKKMCVKMWISCWKEISNAIGCVRDGIYLLQFLSNFFEGLIIEKLHGSVKMQNDVHRPLRLPVICASVDSSLSREALTEFTFQPWFKQKKGTIFIYSHRPEVGNMAANIYRISLLLYFWP